MTREIFDMPDKWDHLPEQEELERVTSIQEARSRANQQEVPRTGWCINDCGEPTLGVFCSKECRNDYNRREVGNR